MVAWRIYYGDGSTYSDEDGPLEDAPSQDAQVVVQRVTTNPNSIELLHGNGPRVIDFFWWDDSVWLAGDSVGLFDYLARPGWKKVLVGRNLRTERFMAVLQRAAHDLDFRSES